MLSLPNGKIFYTHAGAAPYNKIGLISAGGYASPADCLNAVSAPAATAMPTAALLHSSGKIIVAYGSTTLSGNFIYAYDVDPEKGTISGATLAYYDPSVINGPSAIAEDSATGNVLVANASAAFDTVERFEFDAQTKALRKVGSRPFIGSSLSTRCVSSLWVSK